MGLKVIHFIKKIWTYLERLPWDVSEECDFPKPGGVVGWVSLIPNNPSCPDLLLPGDDHLEVGLCDLRGLSNQSDPDLYQITKNLVTSTSKDHLNIHTLGNLPPQTEY